MMMSPLSPRRLRKMVRDLDNRTLDDGDQLLTDLLYTCWPTSETQNA